MAMAWMFDRDTGRPCCGLISLTSSCFIALTESFSENSGSGERRRGDGRFEQSAKVQRPTKPVGTTWSSYRDRRQE